MVKMPFGFGRKIQTVEGSEVSPQPSQDFEKTEIYVWRSCESAVQRLQRGALIAGTSSDGTQGEIPGIGLGMYNISSLTERSSHHRRWMYCAVEILSNASLYAPASPE